MGANKNTNFKKCGEILIDINSKNRKKIYIFHCSYCNLECDQLKKFSIHIGEEHLRNNDNKIMETELKFEAEPEEMGIQAFTDVETPDVKVFTNSIDDHTNINPDPLDTMNSVNPITKFEVKYGLNEDSNDGSNSMCNTEIIDSYSASIADSHIDLKEKMETLKTSIDPSLMANTDSDDALDQMPLKKRKVHFHKKTTKSKEKTLGTEMSSDESKDIDYTLEKESNAIKKHKRCKKRWMAKTAAERKRKQREKLKANGLFEELKKRERENRKRRRQLMKQTASIEVMKALRQKKAEQMRKYRKRLKERKIMLQCAVTSSMCEDKTSIQNDCHNNSFFHEPM